ncbi:LapA family protein [Desulfitibacter alkalitolerans]|uniref:LapA family protein n=1 Tax=Desulfitibacter alkalitolerans TaxID=264641 RepID=UPI000A03725B|nr:lipopolysaccharide assembly protein LapA domain-containing protein [Desulfitibacter alkalitolerans]
MQAYLVGALLFAVLVAIFAIQNVRPVDIRFLTWQIQEISLVLVILGSASIGAVVVFFLGTVKQISNHRQIKELRRKNDELEKTVKELQAIKENHNNLDQDSIETELDETNEAHEPLPDEHEIEEEERN